LKLMSLFRRTYRPPAPCPAAERIGDRRLIVSPDMLSREDGGNINVPSMIHVPDWIERPLGRYYLYFSSHRGCRYIRLAYADALAGPWRILAGGTLKASQASTIDGSVSAPDVHVDHDRRQVRMYFNGRSATAGRTRALVAVSSDGLNFRAKPEAVADFYLRAFPHGGVWYALSKGGRLHRSPDGLTPYARGPDAFPRIPGNTRNYNAPGSVRHVAIDLRNDQADVYYSRIGDAPERILRSRIELVGDWRKWRAGPPQEVMQPEESWEGADLPIVPSRLGATNEPVHQLRDPEVFTDTDGSRYILYAVAGEQGIAMARLGGTV
jgi:hypothetical protein